MKNLYYGFVSLLIALTLAVGCIEDPTTTNDVNVGGGSNKEFMSVTAALEIEAPTNSEASRTTLIDNNGGKVMWSEGDAIGAVSSDGTITKCVATSIDGDIAEFSVPTDTKYAIYPYSSSQSYNTQNETLSHSLLSNITLDGSKRVFNNEQNTMVAHLTGSNLAFKNLCGYIEVKLKGSQVVKHLALRNNAKSWDALSGLGTIDPSDANEPKITTGNNQNTTFNWIYATCSNVQLGSEATSFYFIVPPRTYENLSICIGTENGSYSITSTNAITVNRSKIRPLATIDVDNLVHSTTTDLSEQGVANCYIVPQSSDAGYYSFPAQKINDAAKISDVAYAHLVWSEQKQLVSQVNYNASTGVVSFKYGGGNLEGNALVAVLDANHNALWSWHIWCTDQPQMTTVRKAGETKMLGVLDRNIGATYTPTTAEECSAISESDATAAIGMYYQYGRPTPFPKPTSIKNTSTESTAFNASNYELIYGFRAQGQTFAASNEAYSQEVALSYPNRYFVVYYTDKSGASVSTSSTAYHTWYTPAYNAYSNGMNLWYSSRLNTVDKKSDNDPCPAGYVVDENNAASGYLHNVTYNRVGWGSDAAKTYGYYYTCPSTGNTIYLPAAGYRNQDGKLSYIGRNFNIWAVPTDADNGNLSVYRIYGSSAEAQFETSYEQYTRAGFGFNVRCRLQNRSAIQDTAPVAPFDGEGTATSPFLIKTANDFTKLLGLCNGTILDDSNIDFKTAHYALANDINMSGATITPITPFSGTFDGGNYTLKNLTVTPTTDDAPTGLFGTTSDATIKNLNITSASITVTSAPQFHTGSVVGYALNSTIDNCTVEGNIKADTHATLNADSESRTNCAVVGGIVGFSKNSTISNSKFSGTLNATAGQYSGGIVGVAEGGKITKCTLDKGSHIYCAMNHCGGMTALAAFDVEISECVVEGNVVCKYHYVGGIAGRVQSGSIDKCLVSSSAYVHGGHNNESAIKDMEWKGTGGIVGIIETVADKGTSVSISNSACYTDVRGNLYIGGLVGSADATTDVSIPVSISNSIFVGNLTVNYYNGSKYSCVGGFIGCSNQYGNTMINVSNCVALVRGIIGNSKATQGGYGGCVGYAKYTSFERCYTNLDSATIVMENGAAVANTSVNKWGNLFGTSNNTVSYKNCYYVTGTKGVDNSTAPSYTSVEALAISDMTNGTLLNKLSSAGGSWTTSVSNYPAPSTAPANTTTLTLAGKTRVSIIGDSISTFGGWIPSGFSAYYPKSTAVTAPQHTYWYKLIYNYMSNATFDKNIAWSGSVVARSTDSSLTGSAAAKNCFIERFINYGMGNPDVIIFYGGTNDVRNKARTVSLYPGHAVYLASGYKASDCPTDEEMKVVFDDADNRKTRAEIEAMDDTTFVYAYVKLLSLMHEQYPSAKVVMLIGDWIPAGSRQAMLKIAAHYKAKYGYRCVDLQEISPYESSTVIPKYDGCHPNEKGFEVMASYIYEKVGSYIDNK